MLTQIIYFYEKITIFQKETLVRRAIVFTFLQISLMSVLIEVS